MKRKERKKKYIEDKVIVTFLFRKVKHAFTLKRYFTYIILLMLNLQHNVRNVRQIERQILIGFNENCELLKTFIEVTSKRLWLETSIKDDTHIYAS